ncbi:cytochrome P450 CYP736A12 [Prunus yedoensis var. nudiflora]|uniref:Cytochrome P450 CYP736A12 n=1 Tax=Prunus yedoensis var. nudiflora TaxID=2094558 RepID=A0A314YR08_PRUYE|nr:cytochrome P450 CYP736A12 [Prunus yedoensis var. nudiflora]
MSCRMVLGKKYRDEEFDERGFKSVVREGIQLASAPNLGDYIPFIAPLDLQGSKTHEVCKTRLDNLFEKIIEEHLQPNDGERTKDFVDVMVGFMAVRRI